mmetsp:Transcript_29639/g.67124  ORF Transcript_29639/g.67124 Transcript_29639/m.67124 type:complete len:218 (+) Transcript_29639:562-1215(+)
MCPLRVVHIRPRQDLQRSQMLLAQRQQLLPRQNPIGPIAPIGIRGVVHQHGLEILRANSPVHPEVADEKAGAGLPVQVGAEPCRSQLPHTCIHKREPGPPLNPPPHQGHVPRPLQPLHPKRPPQLEHPIPPLQAHKPKKIPKNQLVVDPIGSTRLPPLLFEFADFGLHRPGRYAAEGQPRAQAGGGVDCVAFAGVHAVAGAHVEGGAAGCYVVIQEA